ncbi:hypothetical protein D9619_001406 [Psilocybe cf. subviscida]|uniref:Uncharacterized protein n=1 Tax=Psilocybe cf. subviscida TaxID=2480587 RepID=A0A8H5BDI6_9AGAR|nr:hypothetical protein D9619_001406 [Psilocybe cf. subviscida]
MSTTWLTSTHIRHPWFDTVMMKRKHRDTVSPEEELPSSPVATSRATISAKPTSPPPAKRRRCSLENGFADLSLHSTPHPTSPLPVTQGPPAVSGPSGPLYYYAESASSASSSSPSPDSYPNVLDVTSEGIMDAEPYMLGLSSAMHNPPTYTVEEPQIPEVTMKTSSWYEPERDRIVVTDIDSFAQSDDEGEDNSSANAHHINPALLSRIRAAATRSTPSSLLPTHPTNSQAVILFKPLPIAGDELQRIQEERARLARESEFAAAQRTKDDEDDAMDIEP